MPADKIEPTIVNPNANLTIPKWINEDYFVPILEKDVENYQKIVKFTPIAATAPGDNYTSIMVRVVIEVILKDDNAKTVSYILKTALESNHVGASMVKSLSFFPKETQMYVNYISQFEKLYKNAGLNIQLSPKCLHHELVNDRTTIVMADLSRENFQNMNRLKGFDMKHMQVVLHKLAEFHAASAVYYAENGAYPEIFTHSFFNESNKEVFAKSHNTRNEIYIKAMRTWDLKDVDIFINKMNDYDGYFNELLRVNRVDPLEFNVLNHGDLWTNNIMFTHDEQGAVDECLFIDFQVSKWGNPAQDLWYLFTTSVQLDIRVKEFDHFIGIYYLRLRECLQILKYKETMPSLRDIHISMLKYSLWAIFTCKGLAAMTLYPEDKEADLDKMFAQGPEADEFRWKMFSSPIFAKSMSQWFPFLYNKGAFDF